MTSESSAIPDFYQSKDPLSAFLDWFIAKSPKFGLVPLHNAVHQIEDVMSVTWFRHKQFQVQLFIVPPNYIIPEHTHPNVDSFELYIGGQAKFSLHGHWELSDQDVAIPSPEGFSIARTMSIRVKPNFLHGGSFGPSGGVFMSVQHWLNGVKPHCVSADYTGQVMGEHHLDFVKEGEALAAQQVALTFKDAASKEMSGAYWDVEKSSGKEVVVGRIQHVNPNQVRGWVVDKEDLGTPKVVELYYKGKVIGAGISNLYRDGVAKTINGSKGIAGFNIKIDTSEVLGEFKPRFLKVVCQGKPIPLAKPLQQQLNFSQAHYPYAPS